MAEPLDLIAESYRGIHESTQMIAHVITRMGETNQILAQTQLRMEATQRGLAWLQGFACGLLGLSLVFTGYLVVQHFAQQHETAALQQTVLHNTQTIEAHTKAILDRMSRPQSQ